MERLETISIENLDFSNMSVALSFNKNDMFDTTRKATCFLIIAIVLLFLRTFKKRSAHKVSSMEIIPWIKPSLPWIGPLDFIQNRNDLAKVQQSWASKYPRFARTQILGRNYVLLNSPALIQKLFSSTDLGHLVKPEEVYSKLFMEVVGKGLLIANPEIWQPHRKKLSKSFNYEALMSYIHVFKKHGNKLVHELESCKGIPVGRLIHDACLEIITEIVMGITLDDMALRSEFLKELHHSMLQFNALITKIQKEPWLLVDFVWNLHPCKRDLQNTVQSIIDSCNKVLQRRMHSTVNESKCIMDTMIKENWSDEEILSESINLIVGGHETISGALKFLLFLLANEKEHQVLCQKEVDNLFDRLDSTNEELSIQSVSELKYLERCIKETLRMYPPGCMIWRELKNPLKLDNEVTIDTGTIVGVLLWGVHRNPDNFPNPSKFEPDRFLPENIKTRFPISYIPFSAGPRNCIGWKMAMLEMPIIASAILRHFDISTTDKIEDIKLNFSFMLTPQKEPDIILTRRQKYHCIE